MKMVLKIWMAISIVLKLLDAYVSLKYEIDEPKAMDKISEALLDKERTIRKLIFWLWTIGVYLIGNIMVLIKFLFKM